MIELSDRGVELLGLLRMYWRYDSRVSDADIVDKALLHYLRYLAIDDELVSDDVLVDAWRKYYAD